MVKETFNAKETFEAGYEMGKKALPGQIYCLNGDLGVGKTVFTQGFAKGLGIEEPVNSPTFTIIQEYHEGRLPLYHFAQSCVNDANHRKRRYGRSVYVKQCTRRRKLHAYDQCSVEERHERHGLRKR